VGVSTTPGNCAFLAAGGGAGAARAGGAPPPAAPAPLAGQREHP
jgi:hypothetical protein